MSVVRKSIATTKLRDGLKIYRLRFPQPIFFVLSQILAGSSASASFILGQFTEKLFHFIFDIILRLVFDNVVRCGNIK